ncbi:MAG: UDP-N-acetylmuramoyl-L-alanyl-D-glutamate--2,6-diaminopimelate ligase, partial [Bacteroidales bacterium]|nr:UDP-N-acetylmuramoyl-L-alanyl-D-glutamate--2,6-diaminopimelate ligase [Bacteroidales bacterium]
MLLKDLLTEVSFLDVKGPQDTEISSIGFDSRKVGQGSLFIAVNGTTSNGHDFVASAIEKGCKAVVCEYIPEGSAKEGITYVQVKDSAESLGAIASAWFGYPSRNIILTGVTGTNGKTTIATTLYNLFRKLGYKSGLLSTVCNMVEEEQFPTANTTPDPITINELLAKMVEIGCQYAFMEVSSHAVVQKRIFGLHFAGGIFTNLTRDHLDYHLTVDAYLKAKKLFFDMLPGQAFALTNLDDKTGLVMLQNTSAKKYSYSLLTLADFKGKILEKYLNGMSLQINGKEAHVQFIGRFNASNLLAIYGTAILLG